MTQPGFQPMQQPNYQVQTSYQPVPNTGGYQPVAAPGGYPPNCEAPPPYPGAQTQGYPPAPQQQFSPIQQQCNPSGNHVHM